MSSEGRLKELLTDHLIAQNAVSGVLQSSAKAENLITAVLFVTAAWLFINVSESQITGLLF